MEFTETIIATAVFNVVNIGYKFLNLLKMHSKKAFLNVKIINEIT